MTHRRIWDTYYLSGLNSLEEGLKTKVRSMTTLLAGNPYLVPSVSVGNGVRAIGVQDRVVLVYRIGPGAVLTFLLVRVCDSTVPETISEVLDELRMQL